MCVLILEGDKYLVDDIKKISIDKEFVLKFGCCFFLNNVFSFVVYFEFCLVVLDFYEVSLLF